MTYWDQSLLSNDPDFGSRIAACAATQGFNEPHATAWAAQHQWEIAAEPGFAEAYSYALANNVENPGRDPSVITDAQLLSAVQKVGGINQGVA